MKGLFVVIITLREQQASLMKGLFVIIVTLRDLQVPLAFNEDALRDHHYITRPTSAFSL